MHITELSLETQNFHEQLHFYTQVLGLPLSQQTTETFTVQAGTTRLAFHETTSETLYHIAFTIPSNKFAEAKTWLTTRVSLLAQNGQDEFSFKSWNADSLYFRDTANHILEFIAHHDLPNERPGSFEATDLLHISEIGLAFEDVPEQARVFSETLHLEPYRLPVDDAFAALGDTFGLFITVKTGRNWFPTATPAIASPVTVTIQGVEGEKQQLQFSPYRITVQ